MNLKQKKITIEPRIKLNYNIYNLMLTVSCLNVNLILSSLILSLFSINLLAFYH